MGKKNIWLDGIMGLVVGDALGCPVEFELRSDLRSNPVTGMRGYGTYNQPPGTWTDDSSMTLATLDSIRENGGLKPEDIMDRFVRWLEEGRYTPYGEVFDAGVAITESVRHFKLNHDLNRCGRKGERDNGNGSLMRILPCCLYCYSKAMEPEDALPVIQKASSWTHAHPRAQMACGLYYCFALSILDGKGRLADLLQVGADLAFQYYAASPLFKEEIIHFNRLQDISSFSLNSGLEIRSDGYVVDSLEAAIWSLVAMENGQKISQSDFMEPGGVKISDTQMETYKNVLLRTVNLGHDTDTVAAIAGGLAGLYYGYETIPGEWLSVIARREWIEEMCIETDALFGSGVA